MGNSTRRYRSGQFARILPIGRRASRIAQHVLGESTVVVGIFEVGLEANGFVEIGDGAIILLGLIVERSAPVEIVRRFGVTKLHVLIEIMDRQVVLLELLVAKCALLEQVRILGVDLEPARCDLDTLVELLEMLVGPSAQTIKIRIRGHETNRLVESRQCIVPEVQKGCGIASPANRSGIVVEMDRMRAIPKRVVVLLHPNVVDAARLVSRLEVRIVLNGLVKKTQRFLVFPLAGKGDGLVEELLCFERIGRRGRRVRSVAEIVEPMIKSSELPVWGEPELDIDGSPLEFEPNELDIRKRQ